MSVRAQLCQEARALPKGERRRILAGIPETELHGYLAELFRALDPNYWVEVTHGTKELGKDIVIIRNDPLSPDVIAVVVKRGDIRAKTAGDVDELSGRINEITTAKGERITAEIISQISQSLNHEAELRTFVKQLKVTKVVVILVGEMSNNARLRLEKEVAPTGQVYDLPWLVDEFTEHYPQVFFDGRAVDFLDTLLQQLERDSFFAKSGKTLSECFVEPIVAQLDSNVTLDDVSLAVQVRNKRVRFSQLRSVVAQKRRVLLVGDPGTGKSKAVAKLCIDAYRSALAQLTRTGYAKVPLAIPIMVSARGLQGMGTTEEILNSSLPVEVRERFGIEILVVDGLDEVSASQREAVLEKAKAAAKELNCSLLVTSRKIAALNSPPVGFERYELLPFEFSQAMKLMQKVLANVDVLPALKDGLERIQRQIPMSPLSLLLLVELVAERKEVPSSITELYDRFLDLVFGRWDQEKGVEVLFEYVVKKRFLAALAYHEFRAKERLEIPIAEFDAFIGKYASDYGWDDARLRDFLKEVERAGILEVQDEVFFRHRSFLDYFVALYVFEQRTEFANLTDLVTNLYFDSIWSEVAFFYSGLGREISGELLEAVFRYAPDERNYAADKLLAGRLLQAGWHSTTRVKEEGIRKALDYTIEVGTIFRDLMKKVSGHAPMMYGDIFVLILSEVSLSSTFLSQEGAKILSEYEETNSAAIDDLMKRMSLVWAGRKHVESEEHQQRLKRFVARVESGALDPVQEARFLLLSAVADSSNTSLIKAVNRRLKRLAKRAPGAFKPLLPEKKPGFRRD